jgi:predicted transcriptional regulator
MKARMNVYFEPSLLQRVEDLAARKGLTKSTIIEAAVASFLSPDAEDRREAAFTRRLDRLTRQIERLERDVMISAEALALFVRFWLTITPSLPESAQAAAKAKGTERYQGFVETLGRRVAKGQSVLREISTDVGVSSSDENRDFSSETEI